MAQANLYLYQIYYNQETRDMLDPGFIPIENSSTTDSEWFEYPAILKALELKDYLPTDLIGVFSPRFFEKTGHSSAEVAAAVRNNPWLISNFSPAYDSSSLYLNPWHQGEQVHSGLIECFDKVISTLGFEDSVKDIVLDSEGTIFSNFFVAPYFVWKAWKDAISAIIALSEGNDALASTLNQPVRHRKQNSNYTMKIFVLERVISFLAYKHDWSVSYTYNPRRYPYAISGMRSESALITSCDLLKSQYISSQDMYYLEKWVDIRNLLARKIENVSVN